MSESKDYNSNFFFPNTPFAKENNRLIMMIIVVWAAAVFGFHIWMKAVEKPVPEPAHTSYMAVVDALEAGTATIEQEQAAARVYLTLLGKYIDLRDDVRLQNAFTATVKSIAPAATTADDAAQAIGLGDNAIDNLLRTVIPVAMTEAALTAVSYSDLRIVMDTYLIHNRSFLTDTKFLGFPFHYFYTAVFLMVLFVALCALYCVVADKMMVKHGIETGEK